MYLKIFLENLGGTTQSSIKIYQLTNLTVCLNFTCCCMLYGKNEFMYFLFHKTSSKSLSGLKQSLIICSRSEDFLSGSYNNDASMQGMTHLLHSGGYLSHALTVNMPISHISGVHQTWPLHKNHHLMLWPKFETFHNLCTMRFLFTYNWH